MISEEDGRGSWNAFLFICVNFLVDRLVWRVAAGMKRWINIAKLKCDFLCQRKHFVTVPCASFFFEKRRRSNIFPYFFSRHLASACEPVLVAQDSLLLRCCGKIGRERGRLQRKWRERIDTRRPCLLRPRRGQRSTMETGLSSCWSWPSRLQSPASMR